MVVAVALERAVGWRRSGSAAEMAGVFRAGDDVRAHGELCCERHDEQFESGGFVL
jgi:hypothetical protein